MENDTQRPTVGLSKWVIIVVAILALGAYILRFWRHPFSTDPAEWGQLGDYLGGILNPIVAFGAFLWLVASVRVQEREMSATKNALTETLAEQKKQAETSLLNARIASLNIELSSIVGQLNHYRARQFQLLEISNRRDHTVSYVNEYGDRISIDVMRKEFNELIAGLEAREEGVLNEIRTISLNFRFKITPSSDTAT